MPIPRELRTERLVSRARCGDDAALLRPILLANQEHLKRWIPEGVYSAVPLPQLVERLAEFATNFTTGRGFRYAIRDVRDDRIFPELPGIELAEIHCHRGNAPSNGVPRRRGFEFASVDGEMQIWRRALVAAPDPSP